MVEPTPPMAEQGTREGMGERWVTVSAEAGLYIDAGNEVIACDRLPRPVILLLKNPVHRGGGSFPMGAVDGFPTSLADRGGTSAALRTLDTSRETD